MTYVGGGTNLVREHVEHDERPRTSEVICDMGWAPPETLVTQPDGDAAAADFVTWLGQHTEPVDTLEQVSAPA